MNDGPNTTLLVQLEEHAIVGLVPEQRDRSGRSVATAERSITDHTLIELQRAIQVSDLDRDRADTRAGRQAKAGRPGADAVGGNRQIGNVTAGAVGGRIHVCCASYGSNTEKDKV